MFLTKKHVSRRAVLKGAGVAVTTTCCGVPFTIWVCTTGAEVWTTTWV